MVMVERPSFTSNVAKKIALSMVEICRIHMP